jgi:hypothetical protein
MLSRAFILIFMACTSPVLAQASLLNQLPEQARKQLWTLIETCNRIEGRVGDPMQAVETADLDGDRVADIVVDESKFPCSGLPEAALCADIGCSTYVYLSNKGRWVLAFDVVGSYCIDRTKTPPQFLTRQRSFLADGTGFELNVRYRFTKGMAFQEGRGSCESG